MSKKTALLAGRRISPARSLFGISLVWILASGGLVPDALSPARAADCGPPPQAPVDKSIQATRWGQRNDDYAWLIDKSDKRRDAYLKKENEYSLCRLKPLAPLIDELDGELRSRLSQQSSSAPFVEGDFVYQRQYAKGQNQGAIIRHKVGERSRMQIVLDLTSLSAGRRQYTLSNWIVSPDDRFVAFAVDMTGGRRDRLFVRNIESGKIKITDLGITDAGRDLAFDASGSTLFYNKVEPTTVRSDGIWRHKIGSPSSDDVRVLWNPDLRSEASVYASASKKYIFFKVRSEKSSETWYVPADRPDQRPAPIAPRRKNVKYDVDQAGDRFFIRTNLDAPDYRLMTAPLDDPGHWSQLVPQRPGRFLGKFAAFDEFVAFEREHGVSMSVHVVRLKDGNDIRAPLTDRIGVARLGVNRDPKSKVVRISLSSPIQPKQNYDFNVETQSLRRDPAATSTPWFAPDRYSVVETDALANDGEKVAVTMIYRKDLMKPGGDPTLLTGYGAYGDSLLAKFRPEVFSLIDRGFVYAIAHVRGGRERGEAWYVDGRGLKKKNSFSDFLAAGHMLINEGYTSRKGLFAYGASAGGLLVGAAFNMEPDLFAGAIADVPFVDVATTATDPLVPLSSLEYREWGDPRIRKQFQYMLSYAPYDNVKRKAYPPMFVTGATNDTQVDVREPAKWVAKLRTLKTDQNELIFQVAFGSGHEGPSGRLGGVDQMAEMYAWLLDLARKEPEAKRAARSSSPPQSANGEN